MMKKIFKFILFLAGGILLGGMAYSAIQQRFTAEAQTTYRFSEISRGDVERIVSSTGTLNALGTVVVGAQVSGIIDKVLVDYNDRVTQGQVLATLDTAIFESAVEKARAEVQRAKAEYKQAESEFMRNQTLFKKGHITEQEFIQYQTRMEITKAAIHAAEAVLKKESANLAYAVIKSPIAGTVIERSIEAGQTITANLSTPTLFIIAADLSKMQIEANVDESDIGQIAPNQTVRFTVQAYPDKVFDGIVRQIRLNPTMVQNVVNYTVIVSAGNEEGLLLPGMTTMADFIVEKRKNVLMVPNEAIRFRPPAEMLKDVSFPVPSQSPEDASADGRPVRLFYFKDNGTLSFLSATAGLADDYHTELTAAADSMDELHEGLKVISGVDMDQNAKEGGFSLFPKANKKARRGPF